MKITTLLLFIGFMQVSATGLAQKVTLVQKDVTLKQVFKEINKQTGYNIFWSDSQLNGETKINADFKDTPLLKVLDKCLENTILTYVIENKTVVLKQKESYFEKAKDKLNDNLQLSFKIAGTITDTTGTPMIGASVVLKDTKYTTITDEKGNFTINSVEQGKYTLLITYVGYKTIQQKVELRESDLYLKEVLHSASDQLNEVVINNGYQTLPKERATGSFATVNNELYNREVSTNVLTRLEGIVPGLIFNHNTVASSSSSDINIDGHNTLFSNDQPLIVVDNFAYDGNINDLNPNDIESVTFLKDAAAASIWGVRSGNGVIVITTKKGKRNQKLSIGVNANITVGEKPNLFYNKELNANDYINAEEKLFNAGYYTSQLSRSYNNVTPVIQILADEQTGVLSAADAAAQINSLRNIDVRNDLTKYFYQKPVNQQYAANFKGGGENSDYYFSLGEDNDLADLVGNKNNRISIKSIYDFYPTKNLQLSTGLSYIQTFAQSNSNASLLNTIYPYAALADVNGNPLAISTDYSSEYKNQMTTKGFLDWQDRPLADIGLADNTAKGTDNIIDLGAKYTFLKDFSVDFKYQYEKASLNSQNDYSVNSYFARNLINSYTQINPDGTLTYPIPIGGILQQSNGYLTSEQLRGQLNYNHTWTHDNELTWILGSEIRQLINESNSSTAYGYNNNTGTSTPAIDYSDYFKQNPANGTSSQIPNNSSFNKYTNNYISYYGNASYVYKGLYTASISGRVDYSNLFGVSTNQKAVPLYSLGLAWNLSKENFYHLDILPVLKPRITYGYTGNINTQATAVLTVQQQSNAYFTGLNDASIANSGNPDLRWEKDRKIYLGLDYAFKNNILSGSFEYFLNRGIDLFGTSPLAPSTGIPSFFGNTSNTSGHGTDIVINSRNIFGKNFNWTTNLLFNYAIDKVTRYDVQSTTQYLLTYGSGNIGTVTPIINAPVFGIYSYKWGGLTHDTGDPQGYLNGMLSTDWASILANTPISGLVFNGPSRPTEFGSIRNNFAFKGFSFSFNIRYEFDYFFRRPSVSNASGIGSGNSVNADYLKAWQKPGDELYTNVPSIQFAPFDDNRAMFYNYSSALVDKGDNIRLQDLSFSYDLGGPNRKSTFPFQSLRLYAYINNLGILWRANKDGLDPDLFGGQFPAPRTISLGVNATF